MSEKNEENLKEVLRDIRFGARFNRNKVRKLLVAFKMESTEKSVGRESWRRQSLIREAEALLATVPID